MIKQAYSALTALMLLGLPGQRIASAAVEFQPTSESLKQYQVPDWFRDAKFGIWSHWGPASVPGINNGYPTDMYEQGSSSYRWHLEHYGHPSQFGYKEVIKSWKAEKFEPDDLMKKYKAAGAKYFVALATHHDNFDNFDSSANPWNSVKVGPHKDIVGLWREAALRAGLRFGISSHADERGWNYFWRASGSDTTGPKAGIPYDGANPEYKSLYNSAKSAKEKPPTEWLDRWLIRHMELVDKYPADLLYFDGGIPHGDYGRKLISHFLNGSQAAHGGKLEAVVNVKSDSFVRDYERGVATTIAEKPWQDDTSLGGWFFLNDPIADYHSKSKDATTVIHTLADIVSKNGNLLMNFPQRGDGSLLPECETVLSELAKWMPVNGEAIFGTRPWTTYGEGPSAMKSGYMNELKKPLTAEDIRFTTKGDFIYAIVLGVPSKEIVMTAFGSKLKPVVIITPTPAPGSSPPKTSSTIPPTPIAAPGKVVSVELLGSNEKLQWKQDDSGLVIQPVATWPSRHAVSFKIHLAKQ